VRSVRALLDDCEGALPLATGSVALLRAGRPADAARLADAAARRQPDDYVSWLAVAGVRAAQGDEAGAARARERARQLNPLR
jgi:predicted Zn-dependent protease